MPVILYNVDGSKSLIQISSFKDAQDIVGGLVETVYLSSTQLLLYNEEGRLLNLPTNPFHTHLFGNLILISNDDFRKLPYTK